MARRQAQLHVLISCMTAVIFIALGYGLLTSDARALPRTTFLSPMQQLTPRAWLPVVMKNFPPPFTISRYMTSTDYSLLYNLGCNRGGAISTTVDAIVVLDFGQPWYSSGQYGTLLFGSGNPFRSTSQIADGVKGFLNGFYACSTTPVSLTLAVGTSNYGNGVSREHGVAWAQMVNTLNTWIVYPPPSYADKIAAVWGGIDAELSWNGPAVTRPWTDGYAATYTGNSKYVNYGTCDGCLTTACPNPNYQVGYGWTCDDIWYVSYGALPAYPLPEIYLTSGTNAAQWYGMSLYAYINRPGRMYFQGSLTEWNACQENQQTDPNACIYANDRADNTPAQGYLQLYNKLNSDSRTAQTIRWSTDISWQK